MSPTLLNEPTFKVTAEMINSFKENGYLVVENLIDLGLVEVLRRDADETVAMAMEAKAKGEAAAQGSHAGVFTWSGDYMSPEEMKKYEVNGIHDMQFHRGSFSRLIMEKNVGDLAQALLGPDVMLHHTKLIYKKPHTGGMFPMHQDYPYFPFKNHSMLAFSIHLDDTDDHNGGLRVIPGSHKLGPLALANKPGQSMYVDQKKYKLEDGISAPVKAGGVVIFNYLTLHGSPVNHSDRFRRNILLQIRDAHDIPDGEMHSSRGQGMILRGKNPHFYATDLSNRH
ncbi:MAG: phytanoyl-CoA dioxygenase family protein [Verrucomicrobiota bacterium]|nr:phytanoyl-CoA dioxygenase family protein [Verrucomicrobiota bacterium]